MRKEYQCKHRGRLSRSSEEISVMEVERRTSSYSVSEIGQL
ncbi:hypothetical protein [Clostridium estertheticum]|nr:hypothetical protein [Clostridium estertheticum]